MEEVITYCKKHNLSIKIDDVRISYGVTEDIYKEIVKASYKTYELGMKVAEELGKVNVK